MRDRRDCHHCFQHQYSFDANNRITGSGFTYDAAGNLINDSIHSYTYDAENRIVKVDGGSTAVYTYDYQGRRVAKIAGATHYEYLFDLSDRAMSEILPGTSTANRVEVYVGGRHLAVQDVGTGTTYFIHTDWLGTERVRTSLTGAQRRVARAFDLAAITLTEGAPFLRVLCEGAGTTKACSCEATPPDCGPKSSPSLHLCAPARLRPKDRNDNYSIATPAMCRPSLASRDCDADSGAPPRACSSSRGINRRNKPGTDGTSTIFLARIRLSSQGLNRPHRLSRKFQPDARQILLHMLR